MKQEFFDLKINTNGQKLYEITDQIITSGDDTSLNDNAQGSSNVNAPGAHRLKIN